MRARGPRDGARATLPAVTSRSEVPSSFRSSSVRPGPLALIRLGITETLARRRLIAYLVRADLKKKGADTLLGNIWWVIDPLLQMAIYWLLVGVILGRGQYEDYALFIFAAILPWKWLDSTVKDGVRAVTGQERLIKQIYFPKLVLPLAASVSGVANFAFGLVPLVALMLLVYPQRLSWWLLLIPVIGVVQLLFSTGLAILVSGVNVFYRDVGNLSRHLMRFWFYLSPVLYGMDMVTRITETHPTIGPLVSAWFRLNPMTYILGAYRDVIYYGTAPDWASLLVIAVVSIVILALSILFFKRVEPSFAKVL
jgi:lipopolysaccharide transport system permease protein/teichoic acid transport system permease protein